MNQSTQTNRTLPFLTHTSASVWQRIILGSKWAVLEFHNWAWIIAFEVAKSMKTAVETISTDDNLKKS